MKNTFKLSISSYFVFALIVLTLSIPLSIKLDRVLLQLEKIKMIETKQDQIMLMMYRGWEPEDLSYLPKILRKEELKEKE